jgi:hypothetical protein
VPEAISEIRRQSRNAAATGKGLAGAIEALNAAADRVRQVEKQWQDLRAEGEKTVRDAAAMQGNWQKELQAIADSIDEAKSQTDFTRLDQRLAELSAKAKSEPLRIVQEADRLIARIGKLRNDLEKRRAELVGLPVAVPPLKASLDNGFGTIESVENDLAKLRRILTPSAGQAPEPILNPADAELSEIHKQSMDFGNPRRRRDAAALHAICIAALNDVDKELKGARVGLAPCSTQIAVLESKVKDLVDNPPVFPLPSDLTSIENQLRQAQMDSLNAMNAIAPLVKKVQDALDKQARDAGRVLAGPKKKFWLARLFGWMGQKWSNFIDAIVGSKPEPPEPEPESESKPKASAAAPRVEILTALPPASPERDAKE